MKLTGAFYLKGGSASETTRITKEDALLHTLPCKGAGGSRVGGSKSPQPPRGRRHVHTQTGAHWFLLLLLLFALLLTLWGFFFIVAR